MNSRNSIDLGPYRGTLGNFGWIPKACSGGQPQLIDLGSPGSRPIGLKKGVGYLWGNLGEHGEFGPGIAGFGQVRASTVFSH